MRVEPSLRQGTYRPKPIGWIVCELLEELAALLVVREDLLRNARCRIDLLDGLVRSECYERE